ncbi:MAG: hypothetical protein RL095_3793 [Verrucomicrobiota bacterium]|jgi:hypothetical protein
MDWYFIPLFSFLALFAILIKVVSLGYFQGDSPSEPHQGGGKEKPPRD